MDDLIVVGSTQYHSYGGAATNAYLLLKHLKKLGYNAIGIFWDNTEDSLKIDPDHIGDVYQLGRPKLNQDNIRPASSDVDIAFIEHIVGLHGTPKYCLGLNWYAPILCKHLFPLATVFYCVTGSTFLTALANNDQYITITDLNSHVIEDHIETMKHPGETYAMELSDYILPNSFLTQNHFVDIYPEHINKMSRYPVEINNVCAYNDQSAIWLTSRKEYDLVIVVSTYRRKIKNIDMYRSILNSPMLSNYSKLVVGQLGQKVFGNIHNVEYIEYANNDSVNNMLRKSKLLVMPSFFESFGIIALEAMQNNCMVLTTRNTGISYRLPEFMLCDNVTDLDSWTSRIEYLIENHMAISSRISARETWSNNINLESIVTSKADFTAMTIHPDKYLNNCHNIILYTHLDITGITKREICQVLYRFPHLQPIVNKATCGVDEVHIVVRGPIQAHKTLNQLSVNMSRCIHIWVFPVNDPTLSHIISSASTWIHGEDVSTVSDDMLSYNHDIKHIITKTDTQFEGSINMTIDRSHGTRDKYYFITDNPVSNRYYNDLYNGNGFIHIPTPPLEYFIQKVTTQYDIGIYVSTHSLQTLPIYKDKTLMCIAANASVMSWINSKKIELQERMGFKAITVVISPVDGTTKHIELSKMLNGVNMFLHHDVVEKHIMLYSLLCGCQQMICNTIQMDASLTSYVIMINKYPVIRTSKSTQIPRCSNISRESAGDHVVKMLAHVSQIEHI